MQLGESVRTSYEEVKAHPLRSFFTLIGVILGTLALVVVLSVLDGVEASLWKGVEDLGLDGVLVMTSRTPADVTERAKAHFSEGSADRGPQELRRELPHRRRRTGRRDPRRRSARATSRVA